MNGTARIHLQRLARLVRMRRDYREDLNEAGKRLLDVSILATLGDCKALGAAAAATEIASAWIEERRPHYQAGH